MGFTQYDEKMMAGWPISKTLVFCMFIIACIAEQHQLIGNISKFTFDNGTVHKCKALLPPDICPINHEILSCVQDYEVVQCIPCKDGYKNPDPTDSEFREPCFKETCPEDTVPGKRNTSSACNMPCKCDQWRGYIGPDPCSCKRATSKCGPDTYLDQTDFCQSCESGAYKPGFGYGPCLLRIKSKGHEGDSSTMSKTNSSPVTTLNSTEKKQTPVSVVGGKVKENGKTVVDDEVVEKKHVNNIETTEHQTITIIVVIVASTVVLAIIIVVTFVFILKRIHSHDRERGRPSSIVTIIAFLRYIFPRSFNNQHVHQSDELPVDQGREQTDVEALGPYASQAHGSDQSSTSLLRNYQHPSLYTGSDQSNSTEPLVPEEDGDETEVLKLDPSATPALGFPDTPESITVEGQVKLDEAPDMSQEDI